MSWYIGRHAELYDHFYKTKAYEDEARFVDECFRENAAIPVKNVLELACGTGKHAAAMEKLGYEILATDGSADMLNEAKKKARARSSRTIFQPLDMREVATLPGQFDAVMCLFDSIGYVQTNENLNKVFSGVNQKLKAGGVFVFEFWHAPAMLAHYERSRVRRFELPESQILRISETELDVQKSLAHVTYHIYEHRLDGKFESHTETQTNRYFLISEIETMLSQHGFTAKHFYPDYQKNEKVGRDTWHIVAVAQKMGPR